MRAVRGLRDLSRAASLPSGAPLSAAATRQPGPTSTWNKDESSVKGPIPKTFALPDQSSPDGEPLARMSLHDQIVDALGRRIVGGRFGPNGTLPTESELAAELGVGRNALREAVEVLVSKGMVEVRTQNRTRIRPGEDLDLLDRDVIRLHAHSRLW